jgi:hypothetical protein
MVNAMRSVRINILKEIIKIVLLVLLIAFSVMDRLKISAFNAIWTYI